MATVIGGGGGGGGWWCQFSVYVLKGFFPTIDSYKPFYL